MCQTYDNQHSGWVGGKFDCLWADILSKVIFACTLFTEGLRAGLVPESASSKNTASPEFITHPASLPQRSIPKILLSQNAIKYFCE